MKNNIKSTTPLKDTTTMPPTKFYLTIDKNKLKDYPNGYLLLLELKLPKTFLNIKLINSKTKLKEI